MKPAVLAFETRESKKIRRNKFLNDLYKQKTLYLFLLPAITVTILFCYKPMYGLIISFQNYDMLKGLWHSPFVGLDNFAKFLGRADFYKSLRNTVAISSLGIIFGFPIPILFAILINEYGFRKYSKYVQSVSYLPHFISWVIVSGLLYRILDQNTGIVNMVMSNLGLNTVGFFREGKYFWGIFTAASLWKEMGWNSIIYLSAMSGISMELYEAARADGADRLRTIWHVTLPGIMPTIVIMIILAMAGFFSTSFDAIYPMRNAMVADVSDTIDIYTYFRGIGMAQYGYAAAIGLTQSLLAITLLFTSNKILKKVTDYSIF